MAGSSGKIVFLLSRTSPVIQTRRSATRQISGFVAGLVDTFARQLGGKVERGESSNREPSCV